MAVKILVVDDDLDTLRLVGLTMERQGFEIISASSGQQALYLAKAEKPDLILLDLMMPDIDGIEVARRLRADPQAQNVFIIMFTARGQTEDKLEGFDAGADDYLTKPVQPRELLAHIRAVLKRAERTKAVPKIELRDKGHLFCVLAAKGGVGVTTVALNLGLTLRSLTKETVIVSDFRPGCGMMALELGYSTSQNLNRFFDRQPSEINPNNLEQELIEHSTGTRFLLSSPRPQDAKYLDSVDVFVEISKNLPYLARYVVLDLGVGLTSLNEKVVRSCEKTLLVMEPVPQTIFQTKALMEHLIENGIREERIIPVLVNRLRAGMQLTLGQVKDQLGRNALVFFTSDPELAYQAVVSKTPMVLRQPGGTTAKQFVNLAEQLI